MSVFFCILLLLAVLLATTIRILCTYLLHLYEFVWRSLLFLRSMVYCTTHLSRRTNGNGEAKYQRENHGWQTCTMEKQLKHER